MLKKSLLPLFALAFSMPIQSAIATEIPKKLQSCVAPSNMHSYLIDDLQEMVLEKELMAFT